MKIRYPLAALFFATTLMVACTKEDQKGKEEPKTKTNCRPSKVFLYKGPNNAQIIDTLVYTYTDNNITKLTAPDGYMTFEYSGGRITRCNYFDSLSATASDYQTATYNSDGTIATIDWYSNAGTATGQEYRYAFAYNAGKLTTFTHTMYMDGAPSEYVDTHFYTYTGGNITCDSVVKNDPYGTGYSSVYYYTYDGQESYFSKSGTNALFNSPFALSFDVDAMPFLFSANNVTGFREDPNGEVADFSYTRDANGNAALMNIFDVPEFAWEYECQ